MTWPGYENFSPADISQAAKPKRPKYGAQHVLVTDDLTLFSRADVEALALRANIVTSTGQPAKARALKAVAADLALRGLIFDSMREATRWKELRMRERLDLVQDLRRQVPYSLHKDGVVIETYIADFIYLEDGTLVVEDSKGYRTREYLRKRRLFEAEYNTKIRET